MAPETNVANTKNWLEVSKGIRIRAYVENYVPTLNVRERPLPKEDLYDALRNISVPFPTKRAAIAIEPEFDIEFRAWDALSDEALMNFERELG